MRALIRFLTGETARERAIATIRTAQQSRHNAITRLSQASLTVGDYPEIRSLIGDALAQIRRDAIDVELSHDNTVIIPHGSDDPAFALHAHLPALEQIAEHLERRWFPGLGEDAIDAIERVRRVCLAHAIFQDARHGALSV